MSSDRLSKMPQAQLDRLSFVDLRVRFVGEIRRQDLVARFNIQAAAATRENASYSGPSSEASSLPILSALRSGSTSHAMP